MNYVEVCVCVHVCVWCTCVCVCVCDKSAAKSIELVFLTNLLLDSCRAGVVNMLSQQLGL